MHRSFYMLKMVKSRRPYSMSSGAVSALLRIGPLQGSHQTHQLDPEQGLSGALDATWLRAGIGGLDGPKPLAKTREPHSDPPPYNPIVIRLSRS